MDFSVERVSDWHSVRTDWNRITSLSMRATSFSTWAWVANLSLCGLQAEEPYLLAVKHGSTMVGFAPFVRFGGKGLTLKRLMLMGGDYNDVVADPAFEQPVVDALLGWLDKNRKEWDLVDLRSLHSKALALEFAKSSLLKSRAITHQKYPFISLPASVEVFNAGLSNKMRQDLRYRPKRLAKEVGPVTVRRASNASFESDMDTLFTLHQARWESKGQPGAFGSPIARRFHLAFAGGMLEMGNLWLYTVEAGDKAVGSLYCFSQGKEFGYFLSGFDPAYAVYSPTKIALNEAIGDAIGNGFEVFDFLKGEEAYKSSWGASMRETTRLLIAKPGIRAPFVSTALSLQPKVKEWRRRIKSKQWLKRT